MMWAVIIGIVGTLLLVVVVGLAVWAIGLFALGIWAVYRIVRGWMRLQNRQTVP
jgi:uncharacterized membrane protein